MKKITILGSLLAIALVLGFVSTHSAHAQMMSGYASGSMMSGYRQPATAGTSSEELAGKAIAEKLQAKTLSCDKLQQSDYQLLGDYYMGLMMGSNHDAMENTIVSQHGQSYLDQMHIAMGERFSGCNTNVQFPAGMMGFGPMMGQSGNGFGMMNGFDNSWHNGAPGWGMTHWNGVHLLCMAITMILVWVLLVVSILVLIKILKRK